MAAFLGGEDARVDLDGVIYSVKRFRIELSKPRRDVSNTEGKAGNPFIVLRAPGYESARTGLRKAMITLDEPSFDIEENVFTPPIDVADDDYVDVKIYPGGRGGDYHWFPSVQLEGVTHDGTVGEEQPITLRGGTDGAFFLYGEAKP